MYPTKSAGTLMIGGKLVGPYPHSLIRIFLANFPMNFEV